MKGNSIREAITAAEDAKDLERQARWDATAALLPVLDYWARNGGEVPCTRNCSWAFLTTYVTGVAMSHTCYDSGDDVVTPVERKVVIPWETVDEYFVENGGQT